MTRVPKWALILGVAAVCCDAARALDPRKPVSQYSQTTWSAGDGLPDNFVQALLQSRDGYLWLGTAEGVVRFDGLHFTTFDTQNTPALHNNSVVALCETKAGALWVGTSGGGIAVYEKGRFTASYTTANGLPDNYVRSIYEDRSGNIWITAHAGGLARFDGGRFKSLTTRDGLPSDSLRTVFEDRNGTLWVGTDEDGVCAYRGGAFRCYGRRDGLRSNQIRAFYEDRQGRLWVGTRAGGLHALEGERFRSLDRTNGLSNAAIRAIVEDREGNLWIGTEGAGAFRMHGGAFERFSTPDGLPHSFVRSVLEDREGNLWFGTRGGLSRLRDKKVVTWTTAEGLVNDNARAVFEDASGRVWIGTAAGVSVLEKGALRNVHLSPEWSRDAVRSFTQDNDGTIWIAADTGLFRWRGGLVSKADAPALAALKHIRALSIDRAGRLWIGTYSGLWQLDRDSVSFVGRASGPPFEGINVIADDRQGGIWLGTEGGLVRFSNGSFRLYTSREGLAHDRVTSLLADGTDTLWIGTRGGLSRLRDGKFVSFSRRDGLISDNLLQVVDDRLGYLWLSSRRGVSRIGKKELEEFAEGRATELRPITFDTADGMKSQECNGDAQPAGWRTRDGKMWFPTVQGVVVFDPQRIRENSVPPRVVVERLVSGARSWAADGGEVSLAAGSGDLEFQFTAIGLSAPERIRFRYRLDGYDSRWVETSRRRSAWYTNLPPGDYRFRVIAYAHDGSWPREEAALAVRLAPRFFQTPWFLFLCAAGAGGIVVAGYRVRMVSIHRRYAAVLEERSRIGREIHDTLMQGVTGISLQLEVASRQLPDAPGESKLRLDRALTKLDDVIAEARRTVLELRTSPAAPGELESPLRNLAEELAGERGVGLEVSVEGARHPLPEPVCTHLLRIAREAVTNSIRHARATQVRIGLRYRPTEILLVAADNGRGFDPGNREAGHFGIQGMHERAAAVGGSLSILSQPGRGTEVRVVVPITGRS